jgi:hypothetical protein
MAVWRSVAYGRPGARHRTAAEAWDTGPTVASRRVAARSGNGEPGALSRGRQPYQPSPGRAIPAGGGLQGSRQRDPAVSRGGSGSWILVKIGLSEARVKIALVSRPAKARSRERDRSGVCRCLCRTLRPAETGGAEQRERWFRRSPRRRMGSALSVTA